ncbi:MAG: hypothetical protein ACOC7Y_00400 [Chloroflexota bacterium]
MSCSRLSDPIAHLAVQRFPRAARWVECMLVLVANDATREYVTRGHRCLTDGWVGNSVCEPPFDPAPRW